MSSLQNESRYADLILYIRQKFAGDSRFGASKLNKVLCLADSLSCRKFGRSITGIEYRRQASGPEALKPIPLRRLINFQELTPEAGSPENNEHVQMQVATARTPDLSMFSNDEIALVDQVIEKIQAQKIEPETEIGQIIMGWDLVKEGEIIPYG